MPSCTPSTLQALDRQLIMADASAYTFAVSWLAECGRSEVVKSWRRIVLPGRADVIWVSTAVIPGRATARGRGPRWLRAIRRDHLGPLPSLRARAREVRRG